MNKRYLGMFFLAAAVFLAGCSKGQVMDGPDMVGTPEYIQIDQETAKEMMGRDDGHQEIPVLVITAEDKTFFTGYEKFYKKRTLDTSELSKVEPLWFDYVNRSMRPDLFKTDIRSLFRPAYRPCGHFLHEQNHDV